MKCIIGLGNPGKKYENNRHNVGFQFVDYLIENFATRNSQLVTQEIPKGFEIKKKLQVISCELRDILLVKPQTFMNLSGQAVKKIVMSYELRVTNDLIVIHDDLDIPLGKFRIDFARGPKLHNGIESIEQHLKTNKFWRIRIGIDNRQQTGWVEGEPYVLQNFRPDEKKIIEDLFSQIFQRLFKQLLQLSNNINELPIARDRCQ